MNNHPHSLDLNNEALITIDSLFVSLDEPELSGVLMFLCRKVNRSLCNRIGSSLSSQNVERTTASRCHSTVSLSPVLLLDLVAKLITVSVGKVRFLIKKR